MADRCMVYSSNCAAGAGALPSSSDAFFLSGSSSAFLGSRSMLSFNDVNGSKRPYFQSFDADEFGDEELDEYFHQPEKKRRLTVDQVRFLEKSFEVENKLEPERKVQLAKDLGLQPRQVAIWFQNRRARWKTKQLEKDFEVLQASYNSLSEDYEKLLKEKDRLKSEVSVLSEKVLLKEKEGDDSKLSGNQNPTNNLVSEGDVSGVLPVIPKQEEACSAKSDILDSDSPHYADGHCPSSLVEPGDSSYGFDHDQSDLSQDEDDNLGNNLGPAYIFPKLGDSNYMNLPASSCNAGFSASDHPFWSWSY